MGAAAAAETAEQCAASGEPLIPPAWIDATHGAAEVVARCKHCASTMVVLHSGGRGQGAALNAAYAAATADLIGEIEADDETPPDRFRRLVESLRAHPSWDGVCSQAACIGSERPGMARYVE